MKLCSFGRAFAVLCLVGAILFSDPVLAQAPQPPKPGRHSTLPTGPAQRGMSLKFKNSPVDVVLQAYSDKTGRTLLQAPNLPKGNITLESQTELTSEEYLQAIDTVLGMNGIALLKVGDKFLKAVAIAEARREEMNISSDEQPPKENGQLVSQMITLQHIDINEAKQAIEALKHPYAQVSLFERINGILLTDTAANVNRILQIIKYVDQPVEAKEEPFIKEIRFAKATEIKQKLEEVIAEAQKDAEKAGVPKAKAAGAPGVEQPATPAGVIRAPRRATAPAAAAAAPAAEELVALAEKGILVGKVKIIADDRTNILIIITRKENMAFFENIIGALDIPTAPDVMVKIIRLEYADAESVASTLNSLIGRPAAEKPKEPGKTPGAPGEEGKGQALSEYVQQVQKEAATPPGLGKEKSKVGELAASNIKILADKRTNSILIMASRADLAALQEMIKDMDIMLSQVLIEVVIFKVTLNDDMQRGIDWVQRALLAYETGADGTKTPKVSWAGAFGGASDRPNMKDPTSLTSLSSLTSVGNNLTYFFSFYDVNLDAIIKLVASDSRTKIMSSPQILTLDNKAATLNVTQQKYFFAGQKYVSTATGTSGTYVPDVQLKELGIKLTVTPHINEKKYVVMEIVQTFQRPGTPQSIADPVSGTTSWPTIDSSDFTASVAVRSGETIVLGGMVNSEKTTIQNKVPLLGDIPIIGNLFKYKSDNDSRDETIVFITPHVLDTPEEIERESARIKKSLHGEGMWPKGWSNSRLSDVHNPDYAERRLEKKLSARKEREEKKAAREEDVTAKERKEGAPQKRETTAPATTSAVKEPEVGTTPQLDPELSEFIERQEKRWNRAVKRIDEGADKSNSVPAAAGQ